MTGLTNYQRWKLMQYQQKQPRGYREWTKYDPQANRYQIDENSRKRRSAEFFRDVAAAAQFGGGVAQLPKFAASAGLPGAIAGLGGLALGYGADKEIAYRDRRAAELDANRKEIERRQQLGPTR